MAKTRNTPWQVYPDKIKKKTAITQDFLERKKAEFFNNGGKVEKLSPTKLAGRLGYPVEFATGFDRAVFNNMTGQYV